ncbi:MAG: hypothetical protein WED07_12710 [Candidatus Freyarchaeum deiterrae]
MNIGKWGGRSIALAVVLFLLGILFKLISSKAYSQAFYASFYYYSLPTTPYPSPPGIPYNLYTMLVDLPQAIGWGDSYNLAFLVLFIISALLLTASIILIYRNK